MKPEVSAQCESRRTPVTIALTPMWWSEGEAHPGLDSWDRAVSVRVSHKAGSLALHEGSL